MKLKFPSTDFVVDPASLHNELECGITALGSVINTCRISVEGESLPTSSEVGHAIKEAAASVLSYGYSANLSVLLSPSQIRDLVAFALTARAAGEVTGKTVPETLELCLYLAYSRSKCDAVGGRDVPDFNEMHGFFEYTDPDHFTLRELALMAGMSEMAVRNATRSSGGDKLESFKLEGRTLIELPEGVRWLKNRDSFKPTKVTSLSQDEIIVPFAKDNTFFPQNCRRKRGYQVGSRGAEVYCQTKEQALEMLKEMAKAKWRRPNENGIPGIVSVSEWKSISKHVFDGY